MTSAVCEKFSSQASPEVLTALRHLVARICCSRVKFEHLNGGSIPPAPPLPHIPTLRGWYFFGRRFGLMRVCGECCGLRRPGFGAVKGKDLSLGADRLWESALWIWLEVREELVLNL